MLFDTPLLKLYPIINKSSNYAPFQLRNIPRNYTKPILLKNSTFNINNRNFPTSEISTPNDHQSGKISNHFLESYRCNQISIYYFQ